MQLKDLGNLAKTIKELKDVSDFTTVSNSIKGFTAENKLAALAVTTLSEQQKFHILTSQGMTAEEAKAAIAAQALAASEGAATVATDRLSLAFIGLGESIKKLAVAHPVLTAILAVGTAIGAACIAIDAATESVEEAKEKLSELQDEFNDASKQIESITTELESVRDNIEEINSLDGAQFTREGELKTLKEQEASLERQLAIERKRQEIAKQDATEKAEKILSAGVSETIGDNTTDVTRSAGGNMYAKTTETENVSFGTPVELLREATAEIKEQQKAYDGLLAKKEELVKQGKGEGNAEYDALLEEIQKTKDLRDQASKVADAFNTTIQETIVGTNKESKSVKDAQSASDEYANALMEIEDAHNKVSKSGDNAESSLPSFEDLTKNAEEYSKSVSSMVSSVKQLNDAFEEQNEYGSLSIDTINSLIENGYAAALSYDEQTGACKLNAEALNDLVAIKIQNQIADLNTLKTNIAERLREEGVAALNTASDYAVLAKTKSDALSGTAQQWIDADAQIKNLENLRSKILSGNYTTSFSSVKKSASDASNDIKEIIDDQLAFFKAQLDAGLISYKDFVSKSEAILDKYYSSGKLAAKDYWSSIKSLRDNQLDIQDNVISAVTNSLDRKIKSLENEKSIVEANFRSQIRALEAEKSKIEETNKARQQSLDLQKAQYELIRAENQRSKSTLTNEGIKYQTNSSDISDAKNELDDINYNIQISKIESQIEVLNLALENSTAQIDKQIESLQQYRDKWSEIADTYGEQQEALLASEILGKDWENDICNMRLDVLTNFTNQYIALQQAQADAAINAANTIAKAQKAINNGKTVDGSSVGAKVVTQAIESSSRGGGGGKKLLMTRHSGLKTGIVGSSLSQQESFELLKKASESGIKADEEVNILKKGEVVVTPLQMENIASKLKAFEGLYNPTMALSNFNIPDYSNLGSSISQPINISVGDIHIAKCDNPDTLASAIVNQLPNKVTQLLARGK